MRRWWTAPVLFLPYLWQKHNETSVWYSWMTEMGQVLRKEHEWCHKAKSQADRRWDQDLDLLSKGPSKQAFSVVSESQDLKDRCELHKGRHVGSTWKWWGIQAEEDHGKGLIAGWQARLGEQTEVGFGWNPELECVWLDSWGEWQPNQAGLLFLLLLIY